MVNMKLLTKVNRGKYELQLEEVPSMMRLDHALSDDLMVNTLTVGALRKQVEYNNKVRMDIINANTKRREDNIKQFKLDMVKEVIRVLRIDEQKAQKVANKVYNANQGMDFSELAYRLKLELDYLKMVSR